MKTRHPFGQLFATGFNIPTTDSPGFTVRKYVFIEKMLWPLIKENIEKYLFRIKFN